MVQTACVYTNTKLAVIPDAAQDQRCLPLLSLCFSHPGSTTRVLTSSVEDMWQRAPGRSHAPDAQAAFAQHCCSDVLLTTTVFAASVCQMAFWCRLWLICQSAVFSQMGPGKGLIPGEHYIRYYIFQMFGPRQAGQAGKRGLSVQATLSRDVALVIVYQCWREDAESGTHYGPSPEQKPVRHSRRYRACKDKFKACGRELAGGEDCQCFLGSCHFQLSPVGGHGLRSEAHHGHIWSSVPAGNSRSPILWPGLHRPVFVRLRGISGGFCLLNGHFWAVLKGALLGSTLRITEYNTEKTGSELVQPQLPEAGC